MFLRRIQGSDTVRSNSMLWWSSSGMAALRALCAVAFLLSAPGATLAADLVAARVLSVSGRVSLERKLDLWAVRTDYFIQPGEVIVSGPDGHAVLELEDGSKFEVFSNSRVIFRPNRGNWQDLLDIFLGKVKFQIQKLGGRPHPYRVNSATALIAVRGTSFEVTVEQDETTIVAVQEGLLAVAHKLLPRGREVLVKTGEVLVVRPTEPLTSVSVNKGRLAVRILRVAVEGALRTGRLGGGGRGSAPSGGGGGGGGGGGDLGQAPPPPPDVPNDDSGPGAGQPPSSGGGSSPFQAPPPKPRINN